MCISIYTSRVILNVLGVEDYGIYNLVGGIITLFTFLRGTMSCDSSRYLATELGKEKGMHRQLNLAKIK